MSPTKHPHHPIVLIDDDRHFLQFCETALRLANFTNLHPFSAIEQALVFIRESPVSLIILDLLFPVSSGAQAQSIISHEFPGIPIIILTGADDAETAVAAMKRGAFDYLVKPVEHLALTTAVKRAIEHQEVLRQNRRLSEHLLSDQLLFPAAFSEIITQSKVIRTRFKYLEAIAPSGHPLFIHGETGVGKELFARAAHTIHNPKGPFIGLNVSGLDDTLFSDALFGHIKGAFTGADTFRNGLIDQGRGGTIFLDEIGDLGMMSQVKLLRVIQENEFFPLGSDFPKAANIRIVVATNTDPNKLLQDGRMRRDLFYRLSTHCLEIPPLRDRKEDIPLLVSHFAEEAATKIGVPLPQIASEVIEWLNSYDFPGNIRELRAMIFDALCHTQGGVLSKAAFQRKLPSPPHSFSVSKEELTSVFAEFSRVPSIQEAVQALISAALKRTNFNQRSAAKLLGISQQALNQRLKRQKQKDPG